MKLLFLGDVVGRSGRTAIAEVLPRLRREWALDFVVVNGENATGGMGLSGAHASLLLEAGADCVTLGDHAFDQRDMLALGFMRPEPVLHVEPRPDGDAPLDGGASMDVRGFRVTPAVAGCWGEIPELLSALAGHIDLCEPFGRIRAALVEAQASSHDAADRPDEHPAAA